MKTGRIFGMAGLVAALALVSHNAEAFDLTGAWATDASVCGKVFQKNDDSLAIAKDADMYGNGFIARKDSIVGNNATCKIVSQKADGAITHMVAQCAAENIAFSTFQFSYKVKDDNNIVRIFPGVEELNINYSRCNL